MNNKTAPPRSTTRRTTTTMSHMIVSPSWSLLLLLSSLSILKGGVIVNALSRTSGSHDLIHPRSNDHLKLSSRHSAWGVQTTNIGSSSSSSSSSSSGGGGGGTASLLLTSGSKSISKRYNLGSGSSFTSSIQSLKPSDLSLPSSETDHYRPYSYQTVTSIKTTRFLSMMGKGSRKKRSKKKPGNSSSSSQPADPAPLRVTNDSNLSVRKQISMAKSKKVTTHRTGTRFRQKKKAKPKYQPEHDEDGKDDDVDWSVILKKKKPLLVVDGYNVLHKWPELKQHMAMGELGYARKVFIDELETFRVMKGWRIEVVFDGMGRHTHPNVKNNPFTRRPGRGNTKDKSEGGVNIVFTGTAMEADHYIAKRCLENKKKPEASIIVATDDGMVRMAADSAGATLMGSSSLVREIKAEKKGMSARLDSLVAEINGSNKFTNTPIVIFRKKL